MTRGSVLAMATAMGVAISAALTVAAGGGENAPIFGIEVPSGYRDWRLVSVAREEGKLDDFRAILGNDAAIKAYREGTLPFPDGTIIARLAWKQTTSEENNRALGPVAEKQLGPEGAQKLLSQSFVAGPALNVQFMVKDSKKYAATGGWGYGHFNDGVSADDSRLAMCFPCHQAIASRDYVFTKYAP